MTNFELEKLVETSDEWIRTRTGISQRHIAAENEASSDQSTRVAEQLLKKRGISAEEIDIIIVATVHRITLPHPQLHWFKIILVHQTPGDLT